MSQDGSKMAQDDWRWRQDGQDSPPKTRFNLNLALHPASKWIKHQHKTDKSKPRTIRNLRGDRPLGGVPDPLMLTFEESLDTNLNRTRKMMNITLIKTEMDRPRGAPKTSYDKVVGSWRATDRHCTRSWPPRSRPRARAV